MYHRKLSASEETEFRQWARDNYSRFEPIDGIWHPVVQDECVRMNAEDLYARCIASPCRLHAKGGAVSEACTNDLFVEKTCSPE